jgi:hypothetical protein
VLHLVEDFRWLAGAPDRSGKSHIPHPVGRAVRTALTASWIVPVFVALGCWLHANRYRCAVVELSIHHSGRCVSFPSSTFAAADRHSCNGLTAAIGARDEENGAARAGTFASPVVSIHLHGLQPHRPFDGVLAFG